MQRPYEFHRARAGRERDLDIGLDLSVIPARAPAYYCVIPLERIFIISPRVRPCPRYGCGIVIGLPAPRPGLGIRPIHIVIAIMACVIPSRELAFLGIANVRAPTIIIPNPNGDDGRIGSGIDRSIVHAT